MSKILSFFCRSLLACHFQRTVISTQAIGMVVILSLTVQSYLDLRALRDITNEATRSREPNESQAEVWPLLSSKTWLHKTRSYILKGKRNGGASRNRLVDLLVSIFERVIRCLLRQ
jgi:CHASE3 domain sensor protein